jgi:uncharacterized metal-binding protein
MHPATSTDMYILISGILLGTIGLDIDNIHSTASSMFPIVERAIAPFTKHRGIVHTVIPVLLILLWYQTQLSFLLSLGIGAAVHAAIDFATEFLHIRCNTMAEDLLYRLLWCVNFYFIAKLFIPGLNAGNTVRYIANGTITIAVKVLTYMADVVFYIMEREIGGG